jgi:hypothetical protein
MALNNDIVVKEHVLLASLQKMKTESLVIVKKSIHDVWINNGGCTKCGGRGWVVVWDTMDSITACYAEYGKCPAENCTANTVGLDASYYSKYDSNRGLANPMLENGQYVGVIEPINILIAIVSQRINELESQYQLKKGSIVEVKKGRKVKIGTKGTVVGFSVNEWGQKCGIKDSDGKVHWTSTDNVCVIEPNK